MSTRWISPTLQGLLEELSQSPNSVLFGRPAGQSDRAQQLLPSTKRTPPYWRGTEPGLTGLEREILRAHRDEVGHLIRQLSFALTRRRPDLLRRIDPGLDRIASARALPRDQIQALRRDLANPDAHQPYLLPAARLAQAATTDLETPAEAIHLLRQAQRLAPHAMNLQHVALWASVSGQSQLALSASIRAENLTTAGTGQHYAATLVRANVEYQQGSFSSSSDRYLNLFELNGSIDMLASSWVAAIAAQQREHAEARATALAKLTGEQVRLHLWFADVGSHEGQSWADFGIMGPKSAELYQHLRGHTQ
jgi:hypothetical protein